MKTVLLFSCLLLTGCVTTSLKPGADSIRVTENPDAVRGCDLIGQVKASDRMNGGIFGQNAAEENTDRRLRNEVLEMGGNVVFLNRASTTIFGSSARGEVYRCPLAASDPN